MSVVLPISLWFFFFRVGEGFWGLFVVVFSHNLGGPPRRDLGRAVVRLIAVVGFICLYGCNCHSGQVWGVIGAGGRVSGSGVAAIDRGVS